MSNDLNAFVLSLGGLVAVAGSGLLGVVGGAQLDVRGTNLGEPSREPQGVRVPGASHSRVVDQTLCKAYRSESHGVQISGTSGRIDCLAREPSGIAVARVASRGGSNRPLGPPAHRSPLRNRVPPLEPDTRPPLQCFKIQRLTVMTAGHDQQSGGDCCFCEHLVPWRAL
jgi:hypothetical protein